MMDNVPVDFKSAIPKFPEATLKEDTDRLDEIPGIFSLMELCQALLKRTKNCPAMFLYVIDNSHVLTGTTKFERTVFHIKRLVIN